MNFKHYLIESHNYEGMFNIINKVLPDKKIDYNKYIDWARRKLKKEDRIIWYLGWIRYSLVHEILRYASERLTEENKQILSKFYEEETKKIKKVNGREANFFDTFKHTTDFNRWLVTDLEHYLSLNIPEIINRVYKNYENPNDIFKIFSEIEEKWKEQQEGSISYLFNPLSTDNDVKRLEKITGSRGSIDNASDVDPIINFNDGYYWVNLNKEYCKTEGNAMGHCGNSAAYREGDRVLSLRKLFKTGKNKKDWSWEPHLTFILHKNGYLGEMKGKGNEKPSEKYHKYIIQLLKNDLIKGITGGGYAPEHNFSLNDLIPEQKEELFKEKPSLMTLTAMYKKFGLKLTEPLLKKTKELFESNYGRKLEIDENGPILEKLKNSISSFLEDYSGENRRGENATKWFAGLLGGEFLDIGATDYEIKHVLEDVLDINKVYNKVKKDYDEEYDELDTDDLLSFIEDGLEDDGKLYEAIRKAAQYGSESGTMAEIFKHIDKNLDEIHILDDQGEDTGIGAYIEPKEKYHEPLLIRIVYTELFELLDKGITDYKYYIEIPEGPRYGFSGFDDESAKDSIKEDGFEELLK